jgi:hypothetical protein
MPRGNPENLRRAARAKSTATAERAERALRAMLKTGAPITFRGVASAADVSLDFLYRSAQLRPRIEQLRAQQRRTPSTARSTSTDDLAACDASVVRTLTAQLTQLRRSHREEIAALQAALAAAHGENLQLRRQIGIKATRTGAAPD